jgi:hypothetical protein
VALRRRYANGKQLALIPTSNQRRVASRSFSSSTEAPNPPGETRMTVYPELQCDIGEVVWSTAPFLFPRYDFLLWSSAESMGRERDVHVYISDR